MRVPPYHKDPGWQRFFAGAAIGVVIGWAVFIFMYGTQQESLVSKLEKYNKQLKKYEERIHILVEDNENLKEEKHKLKVEDFKITINNHDQYKLDSFSRFSITDQISKDLNHLFSRDIESIVDNKEMLAKTIENKSYKLDDRTYYFRVYSLYIDTTIEIDLMIVKME